MFSDYFPSVWWNPKDIFPRHAFPEAGNRTYLKENLILRFRIWVVSSSRWNGARCHALRALCFKSGIRSLHVGCMRLNFTFSNQYLNSKRERTWQTCPSVIGIKISSSLTCNRTKLQALETPGPLVGVGGAPAAPWAGNTKQGRQKGENISKCRSLKKCPW